MGGFPNPIQVALLSGVFAVIAFALTLAQRLGDWRSKAVARVLAAMAALLIACWVYLAFLWVMKIDLRVLFAKRSAAFWISIGALSTVGMIALFAPNGWLRRNRERAAPPGDSQPLPTIDRVLPLADAHIGISSYRAAVGLADLYSTAVPQLELSETECRLEWSPNSSSSVLFFHVWNGTPDTQLCKIRLTGVRRWSDQQQTFIQDGSGFALMPFRILEAAIRPEDTRPYELVRKEDRGFSILSLERNRSLFRSQKAAWRLQLSITFGDRSRRQELDFNWNGHNLAVNSSWDWASDLFDPFLGRHD